MTNIIRRFNRWNAQRASVNELSKLSSRELNDIGVTHGDIRRISREHALNKYV